VDVAGNKIILARPAAGDVFAGNRYFVENVREELDSPGEWYLDKEKGDLYYWPSDPAFPQATVTAPTMDRLIVLAGTAEKPVRYVNLQGFTIREVDYGEEQDPYYPAQAAIQLREASDCRVDDCNFLGVGGYAVWIKGASARNVIAGNEVADAGEGGVFIDGSAWREGGKGEDFHKADPQGRRPMGNVVTENWIHHCGLVCAHVAGVYLSWAASNRVTHNLITDMPRYGISIKYTSPGNELEYNRVLRTNLETNDTGGIETYSNEGPTAIRYNLVGDSIGLKPTPEGKIISPTFCCGIYLDGNSSRAEVRGNIVYRQPWSGLVLNSGHDCVIENNIFVDSRGQQFFWSNYTGKSQGNRFQHNILAWSNPDSKLGLEAVPGPEWVDSDNNLYWPPTKKLDLRELVKKGLDVHSVVGDPLFVDAKNYDYRLQPGSPAEEIGFQPLPMEQMGPVGRFRRK
jgi:parallel beta-helix repeat protein